MDRPKNKSGFSFDTGKIMHEMMCTKTNVRYNQVTRSESDSSRNIADRQHGRSL